MFNGFKTSEFVVTAAIIVGVILTSLTSANVFPEKYAGLAAAIAAAAFAVSRGLKKSGPSGGV